MNKRQTRSMLKQLQTLHQSTDEIYQQNYMSVDTKPQEKNKEQTSYNSQQIKYVLPHQKSQIPSLQFQPSFRTKSFQTNPLMYLNHHNKIFKRNKNQQQNEENNNFLDQLVLNNGSNVNTNPSTLGIFKPTEFMHQLKPKLRQKKKSATNIIKNLYNMPSAIQMYSNESQYNDSIVLEKLYQNESHYNFLNPMNPMNSMNSKNSINSINNQQYESNQKQKTEDFQTVRPQELILKLPPFSQQNQEKQSKKRLSHPKNGPNFPFNLNHLINQINKDSNDEENLKMLSQNKNPHMRPFSSLVYRQIKNPQLRQFYTKCVQQSQIVNRGGLLETIQSPPLNQTQIGLKLFKNVLIKPKI